MSRGRITLAAGILAILSNQLLAQTPGPPASSSPPLRRTVVVDFDGDGTFISTGKSSAPQNEVPNGHCVGSNCDSTETAVPGIHGSDTGSGPPEAVTAGTNAAAAPGAGYMQGRQDQGWIDWIRGGGGPIDKLSQIPMDLPGASVPVVWTMIAAAYRQDFVFAAPLSDAIYADVSAWEKGIVANKPLDLSLSIVLPTVQSEDDIRAFTVDKLVNPTFGKQRRQPDNMNEVRSYMGDDAVRTYITSYKAAFEPLVPRVDAAFDAASTSVDQRAFALRENLPFFQARRATSLTQAQQTYLNTIARTSPGVASLPRRVEELLPADFRASGVLFPIGGMTRSILMTWEPINDQPKTREYKALFEKINGLQPMSPQAERARSLAATYARASNSVYRADSLSARQKADILKQIALSVLDIGLGLTPFVGPAKDLYEGITGSSLLTGETLSSRERGLKLVFAASAGFGHLIGPPLLKAIIQSTRDVEGDAKLVAAADEAAEVGSALSQNKDEWAREAGFLREASEGFRKYLPNPDTGLAGNFTVARLEDNVTEAEMNRMGRAWVGADAKQIDARAGKQIWVSSDQLMQYRGPAWKQATSDAPAHWAANLEKRVFPRGEAPDGQWVSNAHFIISGKPAPPPIL